MRHRVTITALLAALAVPAAGTTPAPAAVRDCHTFAYYPNLLISSARNMTCAAARRDLKRHKKGISRSFRTPGGFRCRRVSGTELGGQWRCVKRAKAYRFEFGD
jgi:hypothetical protein